MKKKVLLIDGNSFCYRAFYAIRSLSTSKGEPTNAVYGFVTMLNKLMDVYKPQYVTVAFDLKGPTFRHKKFADYKAQRKPMPEALVVQLPVIKRVLRAYRISIFEKEGFEADDIIATLSKKLADAGTEVLIITSDKDMLQLVSKRVKVVNPHKDNLVMDEAWVKERFGVSPEGIIEITALAGDASDNIPGVPGIGEATAVDLIKRFGTLDNLLSSLDKIGSKAKAEKIREFAAQARMSRQLALLDSAIDSLLPADTEELLEHLKVGEEDRQELFKIFKELEFKALMLKIMPEESQAVQYRVISLAKDAEGFLREASRHKEVFVYFHTSGNEPMRAKVSGACLALDEERSFFFSFEQVPLEVLKPVLEDEKIRKTGHDLKYLKVLLSNYGICLKGIAFDTMIASYLLNPALSKHDLPYLALEYLDSKLTMPSDLQTKQAEAESACRSANAIFKLSKILHRRLKESNLERLFEDIEMPLIEVLADMEKEGVCLDKNLLLHLSSDFEKRLKSLTGEIYEMAGESFNINSPKQLSVILFEKLKFPRRKRTKTGSSTNTAVLQSLVTVHPIASSLLEFREISKLRSTYIDGLIKLLHPKTARIHTSFNQTGTSTGRLSSSRPNLQNIPVRTELGRKIRQAFVAGEKNTLLLSSDYSQIELRILAHLSGDKGLISAFKEGLDIHSYTAGLIFEKDLDKVTGRMRNTAKTVNFGIIYGMSAFGLSRDLGIKQDEAQAFIDAYFQRYPGVQKYIDEQIELAGSRGFVTTISNRRRYIPDINSPDENIRRFAQRAAINASVQGSASDLIKMAMIEIYCGINQQGLSARMLLQVHDELVFAVPQQEVEKTSELVKDRMENVIKLKVPIEVSVKTGKNWLDVK